MFESVEGLDPLTIGWFAKDVQEDYPTHSLQPALGEPGSFYVGTLTPLRAWLVSSDEAFLLQVQHDRFYLNWRKRGGDYPRFNDHDKPGILTRVLEEFARFSRFCDAELGTSPKVVRTEVAKVDHLLRGRHWQTLDDLVDVLPALGPLAGLGDHAEADLAFHLTRPTEIGQLVVSMTMASTQKVMAERQRDLAVVESRSLAETKADADLRPVMVQHNGILNDVFGRIIPKARRRELFGGEK